MEIPCPHCGKSVTINNLGRPKGNYDVQNVLDTYRHCNKNVRASARQLDMPPGTVWNILKENGALKE